MINEGTTPPTSVTPPKTPVAPTSPVTPPATPAVSTPPVTPPVTPSVETTPPVTPTTKTTTSTTPATTSTTTPTTPPVTPSVDTTKLEGSMIEAKVSRSVLQKIAEGLGITKKDEEKLPTDPIELKKYIDSAGKKQAEAILTAKDKEDTQVKADQAKKLEEGSKTFQSMWTHDYSEMIKVGMVPPITNAEDTNDLGNVAKTKILVKLSEVLKQNETDGVDYVPTMWEIMSRHPNLLRTETTAGVNSPVSGGGRIAGGAVDHSYQRIHNTPIEDMVKAKSQG